MTWNLPQPMLTTPVPVPDLRPGWAVEPKWDGFRALLHTAAGRVVLRSRRGTEMAPAFPDIAAAAVHLPDAAALDGELVVWEQDRLAFERLQNRLRRRRRAAGALRVLTHHCRYIAYRGIGFRSDAWRRGATAQVLLLSVKEWLHRRPGLRVNRG
ncbi:hypothetical protein ACIOTI_42075 [Streptomyces sp. NPDC087843]|uniref:ATP-dependent DNA ligase n=1 Tax=Streptomyces sp. NPDC087843 TaxID=3365804 RepID=UPI00382CF004